LVGGALHLLAGNGVPLLDATVITGNGGGNTLIGAGELALIYTDGQDNLTSFLSGSRKIRISP
jgi:hypothetical protein